MSSTIEIVNPTDLETKIAEIKKAGASSLHLVADFDRTITIDAVTTFNLLQETGVLPSEYAEETASLYAHYRPIELSDISLDQKTEQMRQWKLDVLAAMQKYGMAKDSIAAAIKAKQLHLRQQAGDLFNLSVEYQIPFLIFSAGLGDIIVEYLQSEGKLVPNIHQVIANFLTFDAAGKVQSYQEPMLHSHTKTEASIRNSSYHKQIASRRNVMLYGDTLDDAKMCDGLEYDVVIKIGFLNDDSQTQLPAYKRAFDVVITGNGSMEYPVQLLQQIVSK